MRINLILASVAVFSSALLAGTAMAQRNRATERICSDSFNADNQAAVLLCTNYYYGGGGFFRRDVHDTHVGPRFGGFGREFRPGQGFAPGYQGANPRPDSDYDPNRRFKRLGY